MPRNRSLFPLQPSPAKRTEQVPQSLKVTLEELGENPDLTCWFWIDYVPAPGKMETVISVVKSNNNNEVTFLQT